MEHMYEITMWITSAVSVCFFQLHVNALSYFHFWCSIVLVPVQLYSNKELYKYPQVTGESAVMLANIFDL
jgi:hypothetical protein